MQKKEPWTEQEEAEIIRRWENPRDYPTQKTVAENFPRRTEVSVKNRIATMRSSGILPKERPKILKTKIPQEESGRKILLLGKVGLAWVSCLVGTGKYKEGSI